MNIDAEGRHKARRRGSKVQEQKMTFVNRVLPPTFTWKPHHCLLRFRHHREVRRSLALVSACEPFGELIPYLERCQQHHSNAIGPSFRVEMARTVYNFVYSRGFALEGGKSEACKVMNRKEMLEARARIELANKGFAVLEPDTMCHNSNHLQSSSCAKKHAM
jgi:hypothetical protein